MSTNMKFFCATTGATITPYPSDKTTDPNLQIVTIAAGTRKVLSPAEIEEEEWNRLLATPESEAFLDMLEEDALRDYREGRTEEGGFGRI
jgi:hypothetical protein